MISANDLNFEDARDYTDIETEFAQAGVHFSKMDEYETHDLSYMFSSGEEVILERDGDNYKATRTLDIKDGEEPHVSTFGIQSVAKEYLKLINKKFVIVNNIHDKKKDIWRAACIGYDGLDIEASTHEEILKMIREAVPDFIETMGLDNSTKYIIITSV